MGAGFHIWMDNIYTLIYGWHVYMDCYIYGWFLLIYILGSYHNLLIYNNASVFFLHIWNWTDLLSLDCHYILYWNKILPDSRC